ncbi:MAG: anti-sigma factor antagonist [Chloroflexota bacterium]|nr:anti-sigma factor antagonist [Chloroflexota bacterium]
MNLEVSMYSIAIVAVRDRIDAYSAAELRGRLEQLLAEGITRFVLDLSDVPFLDSAGMAVLVSLLKRARGAEGDVRLVWPKKDEAQRILRLTKFDRVFEMAETPAAALKGF